MLHNHRRRRSYFCPCHLWADLPEVQDHPKVPLLSNPGRFLHKGCAHCHQIICWDAIDHIQSWAAAICLTNCDRKSPTEWQLFFFFGFVTQMMTTGSSYVRTLIRWQEREHVRKLNPCFNKADESDACCSGITSQSAAYQENNKQHTIVVVMK